MDKRARRSWLLVPVTKSKQIEEAGRAGADVVVVDLVELVADKDKPVASEKVQAAIRDLKQSGSALFAQAAPSSLASDLDACVWPGLHGIVVSRVETAAQMIEIDQQLERLENARGLPRQTLKVVAALETALGNHYAYEIITASSRVCAATLGRADLIMDLRPEPSGELHLMLYLMQRLIIVARAAGVMPIGAWWRGTDRGLLATPDDTYQAAVRGRAIGFHGAMCLSIDQVDALNKGFAASTAELKAAQSTLNQYRKAVMEGKAIAQQNDDLITHSIAMQAQALLARVSA